MISPAQSPSLATPPIAGYAIVEQLYLGSRTAVYRALNLASQRPVVIKILRRECPSFSELVQFRNQYTITKNLTLTGVVKPIGLESVGNGYALVMEDWGGISLGKYHQQQPLSLTEILEISLQLADILHELSQHRIIHKDLKPANILIHPETKQVKLIDLSIASLLPKETQELQNPNILEGTLAYLAPEQTGRMNRGIDYRTDFYALGVSLYQLLTGQLPFPSEDPLELIHAHMAKMPPPVDQINPEIPSMVSAIVHKLMAKNAEDRYHSALGLRHDLQRCLTAWSQTATIETFELGQRDLSDRFLIPEKLYGREAEIETLLAAFDRVASGASELMLVAGFSGIGKTAVVNEVHKPITRQRGYFIKGKFDQFNRNIPLFAFVQALRDLMGQLLCESDLCLAQWREKILGAVGKNGQILIEVIPELEAIIGQQDDAVELSDNAAQNRFNLLFQRFIAVFATTEHPLVLFLDDLQWADLASLQLLKLLMGNCNCLLVLGAYRDNEVSSTHPLILTVEDLKKTDAIAVNTITLAPLAFTDVNALVADTLNCGTALATPLAELINRKTQGNPFFTTQFLKALYEEQHIRFNRSHRHWECDIAQVNALAITDDVVEFMALQLRKLSEETQQALKLAACVGNQFDLATLAVISEQPSAPIAIALWQALQTGLILATSQVYKFFQGPQPPDLENSVNLTYRFLHDRIQQAAYSLIPDEQRAALHYKIGQLLLNHFSGPHREERIFDIVGHLNLGVSLITDAGERLDLARWNLMAAQKATASSAYDATLQYLDQALELLPENSWIEHYDLTIKLHHHRLDAAYLTTQNEHLKAWGEIVLQNATTLLDRIKVYETRIMALRAEGKLLDAIALGLEVLKLLDLELPIQPTPEDIQTALDQSLRAWQDCAPMELFDLPSMQDPRLLAAMQILTKIVPSAYMAAPALMPLLICKQVELSIQYGNCPISVFSYADYGVLLIGALGKIDASYEFAQLALRLLEKFQATPFKSRAYFVVNALIRHWKEPLQNCIPLLLEGYCSGLEVGDWECVGLNLYVASSYQYWMGRELQGLSEEMQTYRQVIEKVNQTATLDAHEIHLQMVLNLMGQGKIPYRLQGHVFDAEQSIPRLKTNGDGVSLCHFYMNQAFLCYLFDQDKLAVQSLIDAEDYIKGGASAFFMAVGVFYDVLIQLRRYPTLPSEQQPSALERIAAQREMLKGWAQYVPANHRHRWQLVEAEYHRILNCRAEAIDYYDRAIADAKAHGFIQEEALANELAARFYLGWGKAKIAAGYMQDAYYGYSHWGAKAKVQDLEKRYPQLLTSILQHQTLFLSITDTVFVDSPSVVSSGSSPEMPTSSGTVISNALDLATVLKGTQVLSREIQLDKLLAALLHTVLENAGADTGVLLMPHGDQWFLEAIATLEKPIQVESIALSKAAPVPMFLINAVKRNREPVVVIDALKHPTLAMDVHIMRQQPKSVLCTPILNQGKLVAILYLENHVAAGSFTGDRIELLNLLCAQAAISLENARLYQQSQTYAQQLERSQLQMVQSEKMASLGNLVAGVAHEINNPIGFLNGSLDHLKGYVQDLLNHLSLYQQHYPNPVEAIQDSAEAIDLDYLTEDMDKLLESMGNATERIRSISTSLRTFSRADSTDHKVEVDLHEGIDSTLLILKYRLKANEARPAIEVVRDYGDLPPVSCFPGQINQVFMNILANAIDILDEVAQRHTFQDLLDRPQRIEIRTAVEGEFVRIRIRDNGDGMTEAVKGRIFDHLFTTKEVGKGTGLGLAISRQIVEEKHGGCLTVQSEVGWGSEFWVDLPLVAGESVPRV
ncbi:MAG: trifunctional serine/threonine-protein kinase/ATP-binding protein/sensor histidine kinase [Cyanobacteria bacterium]|nr:trifunctional serine/threonine-protein kinase/ATP-binding protein/sensor histidine kinase [Cyanobacteriota bacterium]